MTIYTYKERNVKDFEDDIKKIRRKFKKYLSETDMDHILKLMIKNEENK